MIALRAGTARADVDADDGGRLVSLAVGDVEILAQAPDVADDGGIPRHGSFLMAPWVAELADGALTAGGTTIRLPPNVGRHAAHGLVMRGPWEVVQQTVASVALERRLVEPWPFGGCVRQDIELDEDGITLVAAIVAGEVEMPAALGWHPWFRCTDPSTTHVRVAADRRLELDAELLPSGRSLPVGGADDLRAGPVLGGRAIDVVYQDVTWPVECTTPEVRLRIEADPATTIAVVYTSPGAVCIEPWSAWPDAFHMAERGFPSGAVQLAPGGSLRRWTRWSWTIAS